MILLRLVMMTALVSTLSGCFAKREIVPGIQESGVSGVSKADSVAIILPNDGTYNGAVYAGSGRMVATKIRQATFGKVKASEIIETTNRQDAIEYCRAKGIRFLIQPSILHWEDRATNWSGMRDFISIEVGLLNPQGASTVNSILYKASSSWWTFINTPPEDMLDESFDQAIRQLISGR